MSYIKHYGINKLKENSRVVIWKTGYPNERIYIPESMLGEISNLLVNIERLWSSLAKNGLVLVDDKIIVSMTITSFDNIYIVSEDSSYKEPQVTILTISSKQQVNSLVVELGGYLEQCLA